jgi:FlaA1/EpsC-like NDP-sugar epimerase
MSTSAQVLAPSRPLPTGAIAVADQIVAILAPVAALALRRGEFAAIDEYLSYWLISIVCSTLCFWVFGVSRTIGRYLRVARPCTTCIIGFNGGCVLLIHQLLP